MADVETLPAAAPPSRLNVTDRLAKFARLLPDSLAVVCPNRRSSARHTQLRGASGADYGTITFAELEADVSRIAKGLAAWGVPNGTRLALLVKPGIEFVTLVFALLRAGMVIVLVDPGLGRRNLIRCLSEAEPEGFVAIGLAQLVRVVLRHKFPRARWNVTVGHRWFWGSKTLDELRIAGGPKQSTSPPALSNLDPATSADNPAAIIFTSGSTGPPKGVLYTHRMFDTQVEEIRSTYGIEPGGIDLACFPLFALFNAAMGVTTVLPEMDFSRPAAAVPEKLLATANDWQVTQAFASPAVWRLLSGHCVKTGKRIKSLRQVFSCGAPVPAEVLRDTLGCVGTGAKMHTPYGATECLPVSTIDAAEVLGETGARTENGAGVCVGRKFESIEWRIIHISNDPIVTIDEAVELPVGEIGELIVRGPQASPEYIDSSRHTGETKIADGDLFWHRMGDVGYVDDQGRFWYCGRKAHRVETNNGALFTECIEGVFNAHPDVKRSALIGIGPMGNQIPVICILPMQLIHCRKSLFHGWQPDEITAQEARLGHSNPLVKPIRGVVYLPTFPVDVRHNSKILRELLHDWACRAIINDGDLYPKELLQRALDSPDKLKSRLPFAAIR